jgi:very-short-patch-repair endonuclease
VEIAAPLCERRWSALEMRGAKIAKTQRARRLRRDSTEAERKLWYRLRAQSIVGFKFVRQEPIGPCVVDFLCRDSRLIVEVDGGQHAESKSDLVRDQWLAEHRYRVLRFWNNDVMMNVDGVLETIAAALSEIPDQSVSKK